MRYKVSRSNTGFLPSHLLFFLFQIFQQLEHSLEVENLGTVRTLLLDERTNFINFIFNGSWNSVAHRNNISLRK